MGPEVSEFFQRLNTYSVRNVYDIMHDVEGTPPLADICRLPEYQIGRSLAKFIGELGSCGAELAPFTKPPFRERIDLLQAQLDDVVVRVAVVGQIKAGKTSVINVLSGRPEFLPTHVNPWTAVPTQLYFGVKSQPRSGAHFEFFSSAEWRRLGSAVVAHVAESSSLLPSKTRQLNSRPDWRRAALRIGDQFQHLLGYSHRYDRISPRGLAQYLCAGPQIHKQSRDIQPGRYADITKVAHVYLPMEPFAWPTVLVDTPGLNDPSFIRLRTTEHILEEADIYIVILSANQPMSLSDITLLRRLRGLDKRRLLIFINRSDELAGTEATDIVREHVEGRLREEFPNSAIPVLTGSAYWANMAMAGTDEKVGELADANNIQNHASEQNAHSAINLNSQREWIFQASGFPDLIEALSQLMQNSFSSSQGMNLLEMLKSVVDLTVSNARRELASVRPITELPGADFTQALAQIEKRLQETEVVCANANQIIDAAHQQISSFLKKQSKALRIRLEEMVLNFAEQQKMLLLHIMADKNTKSWHCDTTGFLRDLEFVFLRRFGSALEQIASSHEQCITAVRCNLEQSHSKSHGEVTITPTKRAPDVRPYLPAVGRTIEIDIGGPWWVKWWSGRKLPNQKCDDLKQKIVETLLPIAMRLVLLAEKELGAFADQSRATVSDAVSATIDSTVTRLNELKDRLIDHQEHSASETSLHRDYEQNIEELTSLIAACEQIAARLASIGARIG